jgi:uncharacterized protein YjbI with pentapeptide repeats
MRLVSSLREIDPTPAKLLNFVGIRTYADLREVNVAEPPDEWDGKDWSKVKQVDLRGVNLTFADATSAFLANADLRDANLRGTILVKADLRGADLYDDGAQKGAQLQGADLESTQLQGADLGGAQLEGARLLRAQLQGAHLSHARLQGAILSGPLYNTSFSSLWVWPLLFRAQLQGADLSGAQLQGAFLQEAQLQGADLSEARLQGAFLWGAWLQGADLSRAQLQGAFLNDAQLQGADLSDARLQGAFLWRAQLQGADLRRATIWRAEFDYALWDLADLRGSTIQQMPDSEIDALVNEATRGIPDEGRRKTVAELLNSGLRPAERPPRISFPEEWRSEPNVMFSAGDPDPEPFEWGRPKWATKQAYDEDLAELLGDLACGRDMPEAQTRGLAQRAVYTGGPRGPPCGPGSSPPA